MADTQLDIVGLGLATLDVLIRLDEMPTWERTPPVEGFGLDGGGPVGTACVAAAKLGARVGYIGTAGADRVAELKLESFVEAGVDLSRLVRRDGPEAQVIVVYVHAETGERRFAGLKSWSDLQLRVEDLDRDYITSAQYLHLDGCHGEAALQAAEWMREAGGTVVIDCGMTDGRPIGDERMEIVRYVDVLISGHHFGQSLTGHADPFEAGEAALDLGPHTFVETRGAEGSYTVTARERFHTPAFEVDVVDTTGAGDVFHGAYIVALLRGWDPHTAALFASAAAALECMTLGGRRGIPSHDEVAAFLADRDIDLPQGA